MKKILFIIISITVMLTLCCCGITEQPQTKVEGEEAWNKFSKALTFTSALEVYSIEYTKDINGTKTQGKIALAYNEDEETLAYKEVNSTKMWWFGGLSYTDNGTSKTKKAESIDSFSEIAEDGEDWTYSDVENVVMIGSKVTFDAKESGSATTVKVVATLGSVFLNDISVTKGDNSIKYSYINPGNEPTINLPNLEDFRY